MLKLSLIALFLLSMGTLTIAASSLPVSTIAVVEDVASAG